MQITANQLQTFATHSHVDERGSRLWRLSEVLDELLQQFDLGQFDLGQFDLGAGPVPTHPDGYSADPSVSLHLANNHVAAQGLSLL